MPFKGDYLEEVDWGLEGESQHILVRNKSSRPQIKD